MESARAEQPQSPSRKTPEQQARRRELEGLELSRTRVLRDLAAAIHPQHREMLEAALKHLDDKIAHLK